MSYFPTESRRWIYHEAGHIIVACHYMLSFGDLTSCGRKPTFYCALQGIESAHMLAAGAAAEELALPGPFDPLSVASDRETLKCITDAPLETFIPIAKSLIACYPTAMPNLVQDIFSGIDLWADETQSSIILTQHEIEVFWRQHGKLESGH